LNSEGASAVPLFFSHQGALAYFWAVEVHAESISEVVHEVDFLATISGA
jgi:hypothetical protein